MSLDMYSIIYVMQFDIVVYTIDSNYINGLLIQILSPNKRYNIFVIISVFAGLLVCLMLKMKQNTHFGVTKGVYYS